MDLVAQFCKYASRNIDIYNGDQNGISADV